MPALKDLTGIRYGKLEVVGLHPERTMAGQSRWICICDCGKETIIAISNLGRNTHSCGCIRNTQNGMTRKHPLWVCWSGIISRCADPKNKDFHKYGGRGIAVCERWLHFPNFISDMEADYFPGRSVDRIDNNKGYEPSNCRWATAAQQTRNRRCSIIIDTPWGKMNVAEAAERIGMKRERFSKRVALGWTTAELFDPRNHDPLTKWDRRSGSRNAQS